MRDLLAVLLLSLAACHSSGALATAAPEIEVHVLDASVSNPTSDAVVAGSFDSRFGPFNYRESRRLGGPFWLKLRSPDSSMPAGIPVCVHKGRHLNIQLFAIHAGENVRLARATELPAFSGMQEVVSCFQAA